ncbi:unnamed protein product [Enterobius vermicularis]|uniref:Secreted protein n=1 Tax=Enterobius vermicularis TaxID=51028 RepID=A0A0N4VG16_ENTVE|nr:unnamed protein product [Enterobius vermicularis]
MQSTIACLLTVLLIGSITALPIPNPNDNFIDLKAKNISLVKRLVGFSGIESGSSAGGQSQYCGSGTGSSQQITCTLSSPSQGAGSSGSTGYGSPSEPVSQVALARPLVLHPVLLAAAAPQHVPLLNQRPNSSNLHKVDKITAAVVVQWEEIQTHNRHITPIQALLNSSVAAVVHLIPDAKCMLSR